MSSHSEILNKLNGNSPEKNDGKQKNSLDDISYNQLESKVKSIELQMTETRNMIKKINESLLFDIKDNFKKNLSKIEFDQESLKNNLRGDFIKFGFFFFSYINLYF